MDLLSLQPHFRDTRVFTDADGRVRFGIADSIFELAIVHWGSAPEGSIAMLTRSGAERAVFFRVEDFEVRASDIAVAIADRPGMAWIGNAHEHHARLVDLGQAAVRMAMIIALRRWRGATVESGAVRDGTASLEFHPCADNTLAMVGRLGADVLFTVACPLALAPAYACRAVGALDAGEVLAPPEALEAQREAQSTIIATLGLAADSGKCPACEVAP